MTYPTATSPQSTPPSITAPALPSAAVEPIIRLALSRGVHIESDGQSLRVRGPQPSIAILRPHLVANKAAIVDYLAKIPMPCGEAGNQFANQASNPTQQINGGQGGLVGQAAGPQSTPLAILSALANSNRHKPTASEIDLALWLTQVAAEVAADPDPGTIWPGDKTATQVQPIRVADAVAGLVRGPRADTRPIESPALWLERVQQFRHAVESARQWRSAEYRVRDWPAELRREPKPVVAPRPVATTRPVAATRATANPTTTAPK